MLLETFLTRIMRARIRRSLGFDTLRRADGQLGAPPRPRSGRPYALYLHIPFCEGLCPYCSFHRVPFDPKLARPYFRALKEEMRLYHRLGYAFETMYVGGGTPTVLPEELASLLKLAKTIWPIRRISVETNPNHLDSVTLSTLRALGVNRLSVGVQSFQDEILKTLGRFERYGSSAQIAVRLREAAGMFETLNADLIFNFPMQSREMLLKDLAVARSTGVDQITFYPLMAPRLDDRDEADTGRRYRERLFYGLIRRELAGEFEPASAWCFTRKNGGSSGRTSAIDEYIVQSDEYAGLGSGSFGFVGGTLYSNTFSIPRYIEQLRRHRLPVAATKRFSRPEQVRYDFLMRLFGGSLKRRYFHGKYSGAALVYVFRELLFFLLTGAVRLHGDRISVTGRGRYLWVVLMREFFTGVNIFREQSLLENREAARDPRASRPLSGLSATGRSSRAGLP